MGKNKNKNWGNKNKSNKAGDGAKKILSGVIFMAACFFAVYVLMAFNDLVWLVAIAFVALMAAAYFFLGQIFSNTEEQIDDLVQAQEALEAVKEEDRKAADAAFKRQVEEQMKSMDRTTRAMFMTMKKSAEAQAIQLANMEKRIDRSIDEQSAGIKTIIKYNKENARQMAKSEKDALEKMAASISDEIKIQGRNQVQPAVQYVQMPMAQPVYQQPVMQEPVVPEPMVQETVVTESLMPEEITEETGLPEIEIPDLEIPEAEIPEVEIPEIEIPDLEIPEEMVTEAKDEVAEPVEEGGLLSEDEIAAMLAGAMDEDTAEEKPVEEAPAEEAPAEETSAEVDFSATGVDLSDPNASLSADDIAKLFAAAGNGDSGNEAVSETVEEAPVEEVAVSTSEADLAAATGVDLSDPNAALSADDIAKLFAAAGN